MYKMFKDQRYFFWYIRVFPDKTYCEALMIRGMWTNILSEVQQIIICGNYHN